MNCDPNALMVDANCMRCVPRGALREVMVYLLCQWATGSSSTVSTVVIADGSGGFWQLIVDTQGNLGTQSVTGPATSNIILSDGSGGFWKVIVDAAGGRGAQSMAGPATTAPVLSDGFGGRWQVIADSSGNLGTQSV